MSEDENDTRLEQTAAEPEAERVEPTNGESAEPAVPHRRPRRSTVILAGALAAALIAAIITGMIASNSQRELAATRAEASDLSAEVADLETRLEDMTTSRDQYRDNANRVAEREIEVTKREDEVDAREATITAEEERVKATTLLDGYAYTVGQTMEPGTYEANATGSTCYWEITVTGSNYSDIVDNDLGTRGVIRVTVSDGQDFSSQRCGDWRKVG